MGALLAGELCADLILDLVIPWISVRRLFSNLVLLIIIGDPALELTGGQRLEEGCIGDCGRMERSAYRDLKVYCFLREGAHLVVEAEAIFAHIVCGKDEITLALLGAVKNHLVVGANY